MNDTEKVLAHIEGCVKDGIRYSISDACARVIASMYHNGQWTTSYTFASTGAIQIDESTGARDVSALVREMFGQFIDRTKEKDIMHDAMYDYLMSRESTDCVPNWETLWL